MSNVTQNEVEFTQTVETVGSVAELKNSLDAPKSSVGVVLKKTKRVYNSRSVGEKAQFLREIADHFGRTIVTRKELRSLINADEGRDWNAFSFITNATECYIRGSSEGKRGVYDLEKIAKAPFKWKG